MNDKAEKFAVEDARNFAKSCVERYSFELTVQHVLNGSLGLGLFGKKSGHKCSESDHTSDISVKKTLSNQFKRS